jgi:large subunit ribosomal protein L6
MSRIGKLPIPIPTGVTFEIKEGNFKVKGPKGEFVQAYDQEFNLFQNENELVMERPTEQKRHRALHGLYRSLINNAIVGVTEGYKKELEFVGVGYKASAQGNILELGLGFSHSIFFQVPAELKVTAETPKGKSPTVTLEGIDKQLVGHVAAKIKSLRKVEPYKGKGIRFAGEVVRRKAGKTAAK